MEIREIDPDDPIFQGIRNEGISGRLNLSSFLQKREHTTYQPPVRAAPAPAPAPRPVPPPQPVTAQPPPGSTLPQVRVKVPPVPPQIDSVAISSRKYPFRPLPPPKLPEPQELDPDLEEMIRNGPPYTTSTPPKPVPTYSADAMDSAAIYGTGQGRGFQLPSFRLPSFRKPRTEQEVATIPEVREVTRTRMDWKALARLLPQVAVGIICVYFGLTSTGSYYQPASRFSGDIATVFYGYQLGTLIVIFGCFLAYDAFRKAGKI